MNNICLLPLSYKLRWRVESNENVNLKPNSKRVNYDKPGFLAKFLESHKVMWTINNGRTGSHWFDSSPGSWPLLRRGIGFWGSNDWRKHTSIYLLGNPVVWHAAFLSLVLYVVYKTSVALLIKRRLIDGENGMVKISPISYRVVV